jgi:hypothetical protein
MGASGIPQLGRVRGQGRSCVEVASDGTILVRDTTNRDGGTLAFTPGAWQEFTASLR